MADTKSSSFEDTTRLIGNEYKESVTGSPVSERAFHKSFDAHSVDSNKTLTAHQSTANLECNESVGNTNADNACNNSNNSPKHESNIETTPEVRSPAKSRNEPTFRMSSPPQSPPSERPLSGRNFFTLPRLLSGRRKRSKRKGMVASADPSVAATAIREEQLETDSIGHQSAPGANNSVEYRTESPTYVKESFFMRLMRHLASPVHSGGGGGRSGSSSGGSRSSFYATADSTPGSTLQRRRSKRESFHSSASNGDITRHQQIIHDKSHTTQSLNRGTHTSTAIVAANGHVGGGGGGAVYEIPAICGIKNHGNTCFMTAIIQCLCNTDLLAEYFVMNHYRIDLQRHNKLHARKYGTKGELTEQLALLLKSLWSCMYSSEISHKFKQLMAKYSAQYEGSDQHDAQEFLLWLLDKCHEDLNIANKKKYKKIKGLSPNRTDELIAAETLANHMRCNSSFIHDLFQAQLRSSLVCRSCGKHSNTFDPYLFLSLPVPTRLTHTLLVNAVFLNRSPRVVQNGVSIESLATIRELRDKISRLLKIPEKQLVLLLIGQDFGLKELAKDTDIVQEMLEDMQDIYALETPKPTLSYTAANSAASGSHSGGEQQLTLVWTNRVGIGNQGRIFGSPFSTLVSREASHKQIQLDILNAMRSLLKHNVDMSSMSTCGLNLRLRVIGGIPGKSYLPDDVDHPLYVQTVDKALTGSEDKEYRGPVHLKIVVEWDLDMRNGFVINGEQIDEPVVDSSVELAKARSQKTNRATLRDCFDMYFKEERLADAVCPSCRRRQQCTKKLSLWSVPDIFIIHLKRFRQSSQSQRTKLTTQILFPQNGLDVSAYIAPRFSTQTNGNINNGLPALWSPWKRSRMFSRLTRTDDNTYDLYAVANHKGNMQSGHYTAYCRNPIDNCWYLFDDTKVVPVTESSVITADAYILFYQRSSLSSALSSCASSSTSGYSSSASSYYSDHWAFRMPPFNYWSPKASKSHDNLSSEVINERICAKSESITPPPMSPTSQPTTTNTSATAVTTTTTATARPDTTRSYASLPSKSSQIKSKSLQTETKTLLTNNTKETIAETQTTRVVLNTDYYNNNNNNNYNKSSDNIKPKPETNNWTQNEVLIDTNGASIQSMATDDDELDRAAVYAPTPKPVDNSKYWAITSV